jgi:intracellular multiplication protein IcmC
MLPAQSKRMVKVSVTILTLIVSMFTLAAHAADVEVVSASDMLHRIADQTPSIMRFITALAYVMGMYFVFYGIIKLKQYGEARTQMSQEHSLKAPILFMVVGTMLLYLPTSVQVGLSTFWSVPNPYGYLEETDQWALFLKDVFLAVQIFGTIAFIRGLVVLTHLSGHAQPGTLAKGLTHIAGGLFCINIYQFVRLVLVTLGISFN